jgi:hypothetical protein
MARPKCLETEQKQLMDIFLFCRHRPNAGGFTGKILTRPTNDASMLTWPGEIREWGPPHLLAQD